MSAYFQITNLVLNGAEISQRRNYGGKTDALHLRCNSAFRLPFMIKVPAGLDLDDTLDGDLIAHFKRAGSKMEAPNGVHFDTYQLHIRPLRLPTPAEIERGPLPRRIVVIERAYDDLLPLPDALKHDDETAQRGEWPTLEQKAAWLGYQEPKESGLPTYNDPIIVTSHTADGTGWYTYKIYTEE